MEKIQSSHSNKYKDTEYLGNSMCYYHMCEVIGQMMTLEMKAGTCCFSQEETWKRKIRSTLCFRKIFLAMLWRTGWVREVRREVKGIPTAQGKIVRQLKSMDFTAASEHD